MTQSDGSGGDNQGKDAASRPEGEAHYQPWLRNQKPTAQPGIGATPSGSARPEPLPTRDTRNPAAQGGVSEPMATGDGDHAGLGDRMRDALDKAGDMVERAEIGRRAREAGEKGSALARRGAEAAGRALRNAAKATGDAAQIAADKAGPAFKNAAEKISDGAARGMRSVTDRGEPSAATPTSQLDRLMAEDGGQTLRPEDIQAALPPKTTKDLPLFSGEEETDMQDTVMPSDETPRAEAAAPSYSASTARPAAPRATAPAAMATKAWSKHPGTWVLGGVALLLAGFVGGTLWSDGVNDRATVERIIDDHLLNKPDILPRAMERLQANHMAAKIAEHRTALTRPFSGAWAGAADGDVTLVVFTDYACGFCRASEPDIERLIREDRKVKVVFRELPIISPESEPAARLALVAARSGKFMEAHSALFAAGTADQAARNSVAERFNLTADNSSLNNPGITAELRSNITLAQALGIDGTPSWIVGDRMLTGAVGYDALRDAVRAAREKKAS